MMIVRNLEEKITKEREKRGRIKIMMNRKIEGLILLRIFGRKESTWQQLSQPVYPQE